MRNPPDLLVIASLWLVSCFAFGGALLLAYTGSGLFGPVVMILLGGILVFIPVHIEVIRRPHEVEIGEKVTLKYFGRTEYRDLESATYVYVNPEPGSKLNKYTGGAVRFSRDKRGTSLTYEIASAIYIEYLNRTGKVPPLPPWVRR